MLDRRRFKITNVWPNIEDAVRSGPIENSPAAILINAAGANLPSEEILSDLREAHPKACLVLISEKCELARVQKAMHANFEGFLLESFRPQAFSKAIELIVLGERVFPVLEVEGRIEPEEVGFDRQGSPFEQLSDRQMRVVSLLAKAYSNKEIARELEISESTVKVHVKAILRKTGARNRTDVALLARGMGIQKDQAVTTDKVPLKALLEVKNGGARNQPGRRQGGDVVDLGARVSSR